MNRLLYPVRVLLLGLFTAQVLAFIQVYLSNVELYHSLMAIKDAGYLTIPNQRIMHNLREFGPAFSGGLFFTFSVGVGLTISSLAAAWTWDRLLARKKLFLIPFLMLLTGGLLAVNRRGLCPVVTSYFLFIPPLVFVATLRWMPPPSRQRVWLNRMVLFIPIFLLALLWTSEMGNHLFLDIRDNLLLSNPLGTRIVDFYYDYTLYPAEVFKSLDQKVLKTWNLENPQKSSMVRSLEMELLNQDYLHVGEDVAVDLKIVQEGNILALENKGRTVLRTRPEDFFSAPGTVLKEFSSKSDRHAFFRKFTFFSLLIGLPISLYIILYSLFRLVPYLFLDLNTSPVIPSILCFLIGITLLVYFHQGRERRIEVKDLARALESERWQKRVAALKTIQQKGIEIAYFRAYQGLRASPHIPERYWLARALGVSREPETFKDLLAFLDDPHPNVVSMAFYALGQRGNRRVVNELIKRIETSDDWYNQWYAYKALRSLGWKQNKSR
jgi:hypothetical protein